jgi:hypothetical protein
MVLQTEDWDASSPYRASASVGGLPLVPARPPGLQLVGLISGSFYPGRYLCPVYWRSSMIKGTDRLTLLNAWLPCDNYFIWSHLCLIPLLLRFTYVYSGYIKVTWLFCLNVVFFFSNASHKQD